MLNFNDPKLQQAIEDIALNEALRRARRGELEWTAEIVRFSNRQWLRKNIYILADDKDADYTEEAMCGLDNCAGLCLLISSNNIHGAVLVHKCQKCGALWSVPLAVYRRVLDTKVEFIGYGNWTEGL